MILKWDVRCSKLHGRFNMMNMGLSKIGFSDHMPGSFVFSTVVDVSDLVHDQ